MDKRKFWSSRAVYEFKAFIYHRIQSEGLSQILNVASIRQSRTNYVLILTPSLDPIFHQYRHRVQIRKNLKMRMYGHCKKTNVKVLRKLHCTMLVAVSNQFVSFVSPLTSYIASDNHSNKYSPSMVLTQDWQVMPTTEMSAVLSLGGPEPVMSMSSSVGISRGRRFLETKSFLNLVVSTRILGG